MSYLENEPTPPDAHDPASAHSKKRLELEKEAWEKAEQVKRRSLLFFWILLLVMTLIAFGLNAFAISRVSVRPFSFKISHNFAPDSNSSYALLVDWETTDDSVEIHPALIVNGRSLPIGKDHSTITLTSTELQSSMLEIAIDSSVSPGIHKGHLNFLKTTGKSDAPDSIGIPLSIEVSSSLWSDWWLLRTWLICFVLIYLVVCFISIIIYPKPHGFLNVLDCKDSWSEVPRRVAIRRPLLSWIFTPWQRSKVSLKKMLKKARVHAPAPAGTCLAFNFSTGRFPTLVTPSRHRGRFFSFSDNGRLTSNVDKDLLRETGCLKPMLGEKFILGKKDGEFDIIFEYKPEKFF